MPKLLYRIGRFSAAKRWWVLSTWVLLLAVAGGLALGMTKTAAAETGFSIPGTEASQGLDVIAEEFSAGTDAATATVVFQAPAGQTLTAANAAALEQVLADVRDISGVSSVSDPLDPTTPMVSADQTIASSTVTFNGPASDLSEATTDAFLDVVDHDAPSASGAVRVEMTSSDVTTSGGGHSAEAVGLVIALVVLALTYGSLVAAGVNLLTAAIGVLAGVLGITALGNVVSLSATTPALATMLGLAVGIDYALVIFARARSELRAGASVRDAIAVATGTAGTAVAFAGMTVIIALAGLSVVNIPFLTEMGLAAAGTVALAVLVALTAVPAALAVIGRRVLPRRERSGASAARATSAVVQTSGSPAAPARAGVLARWARGVTGHPVLALVSAVLAVGIIAVPVASMRTSLPSAENGDPASSSRQAYDLLAEGFGEGSQASLVIVVEGDEGASAQTVAAAASDVVTRVRTLDDVVVVTDPIPSADGSAQLVTVVPGSGPTDEATRALVKDIREDVADVQGADVLVTGQTALNIDVSAALNEALPVYIAVIVVLALALLVMLFRSLLVPVLATAGFLLSLGAALGSVVAIYQWGWLSDVFGVTQPAPLLSFMPVLVVGILFGLAMDYQMFLVSAIHEAHARGRSPKDAVLHGFRHSGPVVAAAAVIMAGVFGGFAFSGDEVIGSIGLALTVGVVVDALVVRMVIMPAALTLLGDAAWWMPRWMQRLVPNVDAEGRGLEEVLAEHPAPPATAAGQDDGAQGVLTGAGRN